MSSCTSNTHMSIPGAAERHWDVPLNANFQYLDALNCIGGLAVAVAGDASASLAVAISRGNYQNSDGTIAAFPGSASVAVSPSTTTRLWIGSGGQVGSGPNFPATSHLRLASVVADATHVVSVADERIMLRMLGSGGAQIPSTGQSVSSVPSTIITVDPEGSALGFFGVPPQPQSEPIPRLVPEIASETPVDVIKAVGNEFTPTIVDANFTALTSRVNALIGALTKYGLLAAGE